MIFFNIALLIICLFAAGAYNYRQALQIAARLLDDHRAASRPAGPPYDDVQQ